MLGEGGGEGVSMPKGSGRWLLASLFRARGDGASPAIARSAVSKFGGFRSLRRSSARRYALYPPSLMRRAITHIEFGGHAIKFGVIIVAL